MLYRLPSPNDPRVKQAMARFNFDEWTAIRHVKCLEDGAALARRQEKKRWADALANTKPL
jgi:hypothetical protein